MTDQIWTRRGFLRGAAASFALAQLSRTHARADQDSKAAHLNQVCIFTKPLQSLSFDELAALVGSLDCDGIEAPVRRGGYVAPERVEEDLPRLVEALGKHGRKVTILTSDINRIDQPHAERVLRTAAGLGIKQYRLAYYQYDLNAPIPPQLDALKAPLQELVSASREIGITPIYQNHSGRDLVGAPLWDLYLLARDYKPTEFGVALDIGHATVEGGVSWPLQCRLLQPHLAAIYVKDFHWSEREVEWNPLGEGRVDPTFFDWLAQTGFAGPVSVHVEYLDEGGGASNSRTTDAFRNDLATLARWMKR